MLKIIWCTLFIGLFSFNNTIAQQDQKLEGKASYYGTKFHGKTTANGEVFDMHKMTAAHPELPFNSLVRVTNKKNKKSVIVRINDRGPYSGNRIIDLSKAAAEKINMVDQGIAPVTIEVLEPHNIYSIHPGL